MLLVEIQKLVDEPSYSLKNADDFIPLNKYFGDLTKESKDKIGKMAIQYWDKKKIKITNPYDLQILAYYLNINFGYDEDNIDENNDNDNNDDDDNTIKKLLIAGKYEFTYKIYDKKNIRQENIFKLNFYNIVEKLKIYFPTTKIQIFFEKPTSVDKELKKISSTYKHDIIINLSQKNDDIDEDDDNINIINITNIFEIVLEYFEKIHNRFNDEDKRISTNLFSDEYYVYNVNEDDMHEFMENTIYEIIKNICAVNNDEYELSKILYFNKNYKKKNIKKDITHKNNLRSRRIIIEVYH